MVKPRGVAIEDKVPSIIDILVGVGLRQGSSLFFTDVSINATNISLSLSTMFYTISVQHKYSNDIS
jgi:hypothetical protein